jgi:hypothetical protein
MARDDQWLLIGPSSPEAHPLPKDVTVVVGQAPAVSAVAVGGRAPDRVVGDRGDSGAGGLCWCERYTRTGNELSNMGTDLPRFQDACDLDPWRGP